MILVQSFWSLKCEDCRIIVTRSILDELSEAEWSDVDTIWIPAPMPAPSSEYSLPFCRLSCVACCAALNCEWRCSGLQVIANNDRLPRVKPYDGRSRSVIIVYADWQNENSVSVRDRIISHRRRLDSVSPHLFSWMPFTSRGAVSCRPPAGRTRLWH